ncbi:MAG: hypothetical protein K6D97_05425 [Clostridia bacterium]|nr:hypothetical protein [Clostridia bacterium]
MKINDVIVEANKNIITLNTFLYSCIGTILLNTAVGVIIAALVIVSSILLMVFKNVFLGAALTFLVFLISGLSYVALTYGVIVYIYELANGNDAHPMDIFRNSISKARIVLTVFFRVICKFIIEIIILIASGIVACLAILSVLILFIKTLSEGIFMGYSELAGKSSGNFTQLISYLSDNTNKIIMALIVSVGVFLLTSFIIFVRKMSYSLTDFLIYENDEYNSKEIIKKSKELMKGKKLTYFGIAILPSLLTIAFGILYYVLNISEVFSGTIFTILSIVATTYALILQVAFYRIVKKEY